MKTKKTIHNLISLLLNHTSDVRSVIAALYVYCGWSKEELLKDGFDSEDVCDAINRPYHYFTDDTWEI